MAKVKQTNDFDGQQQVGCAMCHEYQNKIEQLKNDAKVSEMQTLKTQLFQVQQKYEEEREKYEHEKQEKDQLLLRLSALASSRLRDNNPNIADLSDPNRPTKLAERMSELYDNQWTDAYDELEKTRSVSEREIIQMLLDVLMTVYEECRSLSGPTFLQRVQRSIEVFPGIDFDELPELVMPEELKHQLKEFRKRRAPEVIKDIEKIVESQGKLHRMLPSNVGPALTKYIQSCVHLCWLSVVQDPPVVFSISSTGKFNSAEYRDYTARGPFVEYIVWPVLHLHENGPLLCKGVAQGCKTSPPKLSATDTTAMDVDMNLRRLDKTSRLVSQQSESSTRDVQRELMARSIPEPEGKSLDQSASRRGRPGKYRPYAKPGRRNR